MFLLSSTAGKTQDVATFNCENSRMVRHRCAARDKMCCIHCMTETVEFISFAGAPWTCWKQSEAQQQ